MTTAHPKCLKFSFKTKYPDGDDCDIATSDPICVNGAYTFKASGGADVTAFLTTVLSTSFPNSASDIAAYYATQFDALLAAGVSTFVECKQFPELDAASAPVDGYEICTCLCLASKKRKICLCDDCGCDSK